MGAVRAMEMIEFVGPELALRDHLQHNHFPPVSARWIPACQNAIDALQQDEPDAEIDTPEGGVMRADRIVRGLHLEPFVEVRMDGPAAGEEY